MLHPTFRRCLFWAHLATGLVVGLVILLLAVTGVVMSFEPQIVARAERAVVREKANGQTTPLTPEELVAKFEQSDLKGKPGTLNLTSEPEDPAIFLINKGNQHLFHPTTGEPLGKGAVGLRRFFQINLSLHRWLTWPAPQTGEGERKPEGEGKKETTWKDVGGHINAAGTLAFLFLLLSGLFLWIPKKRTWKAFKAVLTLQIRLKGRARDWNWHNLAGFWFSPFLLLIAVTGLIMFYPWANKLLFNAFGEPPPAKRETAAAPKTGDQRPPIFAAGLNQAYQAAAQTMPGWRSMSLELPENGDKPFAVTVTDAGRGRPDRRVKLTIDRATFDVIGRESEFQKLTPGGRMRQFVRWTHTGEIGGWAGQLVAALTAAATLVLIWTGFALAWRRFAKK